MKRFIGLAILIMILMMIFALPVSAHNVGPCNDADGDGSSSGREYAEHHISDVAKSGGMGNDGHKPGSHKGFSVCNPSGN